MRHSPTTSPRRLLEYPPSIGLMAALLGAACSGDGEPSATPAGMAGSGRGGVQAGSGGAGASGGQPINGSATASADDVSLGGTGAGTGGNMPSSDGGASGGDGTPPAAAGPTLPGRVQRPSPIISRGAAVFANTGQGAAVVDGQYHNGGWLAGSPTDAAPSWVALKLEEGPARLLVSWDDGGTYNYRDATDITVYGLPGAYHIDVSADSTNGVDGTWEVVADVTGNAVRTRAHSFDFVGKSWVKLVITAPPPNANGGTVQIGEIDVHDISSAGAALPEDTWFFMGDSITAFAYDRAQIHQPSFAAAINAAAPGFFPAMINGGIGGETTTGALARLPEASSLNPDYRFFILGYGTNDAANNQVPVATFKANLQAMIDSLRAAGREVLIPHIPPSEDGQHASIPAYNTAIDELIQENALTPGADLHSYFMSTAGLFTCPPCQGGRMTDNLHPNDTGLAGMNTTWAQAMRASYP